MLSQLRVGYLHGRIAIFSKLDADTINTKKGKAHLVKTDIFKGLMFYVYEDFNMKGVFHPLDKERVKEILASMPKVLYLRSHSVFCATNRERARDWLC